MNSHDRSENLFTLFSDGTLLYKDIKFETFQLFPQKNLVWNKSSPHSGETPFLEGGGGIHPLAIGGLCAPIHQWLFP